MDNQQRRPRRKSSEDTEFTSLDDVQLQKVLENLRNSGGIFFTLEQMLATIAKFGNRITVKELQERQEEQKKENPEQ